MRNTGTRIRPLRCAELPAQRAQACGPTGLYEALKKISTQRCKPVLCHQSRHAGKLGHAVGHLHEPLAAVMGGDVFISSTLVDGRELT